MDSRSLPWMPAWHLEFPLSRHLEMSFRSSSDSPPKGRSRMAWNWVSSTIFSNHRHPTNEVGTVVWWGFYLVSSICLLLVMFQYPTISSHSWVLRLAVPVCCVDNPFTVTFLESWSVLSLAVTLGSAGGPSAGPLEFGLWLTTGTLLPTPL